MRTLRLPATTVQQLRETLLAEDGQERFAFVDAGLSDGDMLGGEVIPIPDDQLTTQSATACRPDPALERQHIADCRDTQRVPILVHSHPFSEKPAFSGIDIEAMGRFRKWLTELFPELDFGFAVVGSRGIEAVVRDEDRFTTLPIEVIGDWKLETTVPNTSSRFQASPSADESEDTGDDDMESISKNDQLSPDQDQFDRNIRALGQDGQDRLQETTVGIVGLGGIGSMVAEQLARLGVRDFVCIDPDIVERSNLPRLAGAYSHHVGSTKLTAVSEHIRQISGGDATITSRETPVQEVDDALDRCDIIVGCVDRVSARSFCNEYAVKHLTYYLDAGVRIDTTNEEITAMRGYLQLVAPGSTACFDCLGRHDQQAARLEQMQSEAREAEQQRGYVDDEQLAPEPSIIHLNGLCASKAISILTSVVTGCNTPPDFVRFDDLTHEMNALRTKPSPACPTCGEQGVLGVGRRSFGDIETTVERDTAEIIE